MAISSALATATLPASLERRRESTSSVSSASSSLTLDLNDDPSVPSPSPPSLPRTVRQGKDYRPPSTFYKKSWTAMTHNERLCNLATCPDELHVVRDDPKGPVPRKSILPEQWFIFCRAMIPIALQAASYRAFPDYKWPASLAYPVYLLSFVAFALAVVHRMNHYCLQLGTFDEENFGRDRTPDKAVDGLARGITVYMFLRTALPFFYYYNKAENPLFSFTWSFPLRLAAWQLTLDLFFYIYHRSSHEFDSLWFIHMHHHTTKHPTAILSILAGDYQECIEIALVPIVATMLVPMTFPELYFTLCTTLYVEMLGHSGVRAHWGHPVLWPLKYVDMDLCVEDHDLHHRYGKSGKNYGKQSRVWDKLFGTSADRLETKGM